MKGFLGRVLRYSFLVTVLSNNNFCAETVSSDTLSLTEQQALAELLTLAAKAPRPEAAENSWPIPDPSECGCDAFAIKNLLVQIRERLGLPSCGCDTVFNCLCDIKALVEASGASGIDTIASYVEVINSKIDDLDPSNLSSELDVCCTAMNSKLDLLVANESGFESKLDDVANSIGDILVETDIIMSGVDACCSTMNSKVDALQETMLDQFMLVDTDLSSIDHALQNLTESSLDHFSSTFDILVSLSDDLLETMTALKEIASDIEASLTNLDELLNKINEVDAEVEIVDSKLDACCFTSNSKLDALSEDVSVVENMVDAVDTSVGVVGDLVTGVGVQVTGVQTSVNEAQESINELLVDTSIIDSKLDACCFTSNNKLDALQGSVGEVMGSVLEVLDDVSGVQTSVNEAQESINELLVDTSIIDSKLDACCFMSNNKLDAMQGSVGEVMGSVLEVLDDVSGVQTSVNEAQESINELLVDTSIIDSKLDACCFTSSNKLDALQGSVGEVMGSVLEVLDDVSGVQSSVNEAQESINELLVDTSIIDSKLDACCFTSNNKLDALQSSVGEVMGSVLEVLDDVSGVQSSVNQAQESINELLVDTSIIDSKLDACCFTSNSKLDALQGSVGEVMSSMLEVIGDVGEVQESVNEIVDNTSIIDSKLDACCFTSNSKLDALQGSVGEVMSSMLEVIGDVGEVQESVNEIVDNTSIIDSKLEACCFTSNSKLDVLQGSVGEVMSSVLEVIGDVGEVQESVNELLVDASIIDSKLDACCFTSNSKLDFIIELDKSIIDNLNVAVDLTEVQESVNDILENTSIIDSKLDACCFTSNSKLDFIIELDKSILDNLNVAVDLTEVQESVNDILENTSIIDSKLDACCFTSNSKLDALQGSVGEVMGSLLEVAGDVGEVQESVNEILEDTSIIDSKLDSCCFTSNSKLDILIGDAITIDSKIDILVDGIACDPVPLTTADITGDLILLDEPGNYCLSTDLTATVSIVVDNVTLCLNNRELTGQINVYGSQAYLKNGRVTAPGDGTSPVITIAKGASGTMLSNVSATAQNALSAIAGRDALAITADNVFVEKGVLQSGSAITGAGGHGIHCIEPCTKAVIRAVDIIGTGSGTGADGGDGIRIEAGCSSIEIRGCTISNTGASDTGNAGMAINDQHETSPASYSSVILNNLAYDIANTSTVYEIRNLGAPGPDQGVSIIVGTPGLYDNVYLP